MLDNDASSPADICGCGEAARREGKPGAACRIRVLLPLPLPAALDYLAPEGAASPEPGSFVRVPLGTRNLVGVVWEGTAGELPAGRLRPLLEILTPPPLRPELRRFVERVAAYTMAPLGMVLRMTMAVAAALEPPRPRRLCALASAGCAALSGAASGTHLTAARKRVLEKLRNRPPLAVSELARLAECGPGVVRGLVRRGLWRAVVDGRTRVVVGARSALFLPFPELGLIIVDEEHDSSYKQEDGVIYQARDMAVLRASLAQIPIVLVSATPSLETVVNVGRGRYERVHLPRRHAEARLPEIALIDMRRERIEPRRFLSAPLVEALGRTLDAGEQSLLFLNRRGYAPLTLCRACGH